MAEMDRREDSPNAHDTKRFLFVCVHNSGRSQMAEAFFNRMAPGKARASSAGTDPASAVDPTVVEVMKEAGIDISGNVPKGLKPEMLDGVTRVITMGCGAEEVCPATFIETEDWDLDDPKGQAIDKVREIRDEIRQRVERLLADLQE